MLREATEDARSKKPHEGGVDDKPFSSEGHTRADIRERRVVLKKKKEKKNRGVDSKFQRIGRGRERKKKGAAVRPAKGPRRRTVRKAEVLGSSSGQREEKGRVRLSQRNPRSDDRGTRVRQGHRKNNTKRKR